MLTWILTLLLLSGSVKNYREKLKKLEAELQTTRSRLKKLKAREADLKEEIKYLNREEEILRSMIQILQEREKELKQELLELDRGISTAENILDTSLLKMRGGLIALYRTRKPSFLEALVNTGSLYKAFDKVRASRLLLEREKKYYEKILKAKRNLTRFKEERAKDLTELAAIKDEILRKKRRLEATERKKRKKLRSIKSEKRAKEKYIKKLEASIRDLEKLIKKLEKKRKKPQKIYTLKGKKLLKPVDGRIISYFGTLWHPKYKTKTRNNGIDIRAKPGDFVLAVESGQVAYSGDFLGYGNMVIIDHGGLFSIYSGLGELFVREGQGVTRGKPIGRIAGKDSPQGPVLHFELRLGGKPVNPLKYIRW